MTRCIGPRMPKIGFVLTTGLFKAMTLKKTYFDNIIVLHIKIICISIFQLQLIVDLHNYVMCVLNDNIGITKLFFFILLSIIRQSISAF